MASIDQAQSALQTLQYESHQLKENQKAELKRMRDHVESFKVT
jgi:hypothetical protein